jgi:hypothetical protein
MAGVSAGDLFVRRVRYCSAGVTRHCVFNAAHPFEIGLNAPEASAGDNNIPSLASACVGGLQEHSGKNGQRQGNRVTTAKWAHGNLLNLGSICVINGLVCNFRIGISLEGEIELPLACVQSRDTVFKKQDWSETVK